MNPVPPPDSQEFKELVTTLMIRGRGLADGRVQEATRLLYRLAIKRFGKPSHQTSGRLDAIRDIDRLEALADRLIDPQVTSWDDFLHEA